MASQPGGSHQILLFEQNKLDNDFDCINSLIHYAFDFSHSTIWQPLVFIVDTDKHAANVQCDGY